jgi:hypothetical protein
MDNDSKETQYARDRQTPAYDVVERELRDFPAVLGPTITKEGLDRWAKDSVVRAGRVSASRPA